jgi:hypothetical protein
MVVAPPISAMRTVIGGSRLLGRCGCRRRQSRSEDEEVERDQRDVLLTRRTSARPEPVEVAGSAAVRDDLAIEHEATSDRYKSSQVSRPLGSVPERRSRWWLARLHGPRCSETGVAVDRGVREHVTDARLAAFAVVDPALRAVRPSAPATRDPASGVRARHETRYAIDDLAAVTCVG